MIKLNENDRVFIVKNRAPLLALFRQRVEALKAEVFGMERGEKREAKVDLTVEFMSWIAEIESCTLGEPQETSSHI